MEETKQLPPSDNRTIPKKIYSTPILQEYGKIKDLTASGTGKRGETLPGADKRQRP
jgi:hypothetical protein